MEQRARWVELRVDEYGGPLWSDQGALGDEPPELAVDPGLSRGLVEAVLAWHADALAAGAADEFDLTGDLFVRHQALLAAVRSELPSHIGVPEPLDAEPVRIRLRTLTVGELERLPPLPEEVERRLRSWLEERAAYDDGTDENRDAIFAWQDAATPLAREVGAAWGNGYAVRPF